MNLENPAFWRGVGILAVFAALALLFIIRSVRKATEPSLILRKWIVTVPLIIVCLVAVPIFSVFGLLLIVGCAAILSWMWTPHIGAAFAKPLTSLFDGGDLPPEPRPFYSIALAKQKKGLYLEAVAEVRKQLTRFPTDFEGHMLLAQIQAEHLNDLPGAELTIHRLCAQPGHAPANIAYALYTLADWHLKQGMDPDSARQSLEKVIELLPDTEFALTAAQRIAHLSSPEMLASAAEPRAYAVPRAIKNLGLLRGTPAFQPETDPSRAAAMLVAHLEQHPLDAEAREELAKIYVDTYGRLDLAADQLEQLIQHPNQPDKLLVRWLNLLADLQIRAGADYEAVRHTLERIIELGPNLAPADNARKRIDLLRLELKAKTKSQAVKLGSYEQNLGLKRGLPGSG